ncbi:MAG: hypothetical protein IJ415_02985 [Clostridia bacterium]|nr:hypothetical protein [Clostridia bacterium]
MEILDEVILGYRKLFNDTGNPEFFVRLKNVERLQKNIALVEEIEKEDGLSL